MWARYAIRDGWYLGASVEQFQNLPDEQAQIENPADITTADPPWVYDGANLRDATAGEISASPANRLLDQRDADIRRLNAAIDNQADYYGRLVRSLAVMVLNEMNLHADKFNEILNAVDSAANFSQVKSNFAAITDYPQRTKTQMVNSIKANVSADE
jgi:hypothetical protein